MQEEEQLLQCLVRLDILQVENFRKFPFWDPRVLTVKSMGAFLERREDYAFLTSNWSLDMENLRSVRVKRAPEWVDLNPKHNKKKLV